MATYGTKIIVEGCDGVGKTTFINKLIEDHPECNFKVIHCTRHTMNNYKYFMSLLKNKENIIFDRAFIGQFVYNTREERLEKGWLTTSQLRKIEKFINKRHNIIVYYLSADDNKILYNCKKDAEDSYYTIDYIKNIKAGYEYYFRNSHLHNYEKIFIDLPDYDGEYEITEEEKDKITSSFDYSSLPKIYAVDFDGTIARNAFPEITSKTVPNMDLINRLKRAKESGVRLILWTNRTGSALVDACNYCANFGLTFDEVNDNVEEVRKNLFGGPRKVYADLYIDDKAELVTCLATELKK